MLITSMFSTPMLSTPMLSTYLLIAFLLLLILALWCGLFPRPNYEYSTKQIKIGTNILTILIADSYTKLFFGLSKQSKLDKMLFKYNDESKRKIAMRNMEFGLDILFIDKHHTIQQIESLHKPKSLVEYYITYDIIEHDAQYVIEMPYGWCSEHNVDEGDSISIQ